MEYSNFKIQIQLPDGSKQLVWEQTVEGDIEINKEMDAYVKELEADGHKVVYAKRAVFGGKSLFNDFKENKPENFVGRIFKNTIVKLK
tara:strand:+ start:478 stop:741 length:264 start_codon:yes stop_codon:yes gene_type:complete